MIKKLKIKNVQAYEDTELEFESGLNMITGGNDVGKTAIVRSIKLVLENRPLGDGLIRKGQEEPAEVEITTEDVTVTRTKGKKVNSYSLSSYPEPFTSFGTNPPEEVIEALNFQDVNVQPQLERPFLVLDPPGQVAQHIREIADLDIIDKVVSLLESKVRTASDCLKKDQKSLEEVDKKLKVVSKIDIKNLERLISSAKELLCEREALKLMTNSLSSFISELSDIEAHQVNLPEDIVQRIEKSKLAINDYQDSYSTFDRLNDIVSKLEELERNTVVLPENINSKISQADEVQIQYNNIGRRISSLSGIIAQLESIDVQLEKYNRELIDKQSELIVLLTQLDTCPSCGQELTEEAKETLLLEEQL